jgi:acylpyruvate hydrolase
MTTVPRLKYQVEGAALRFTTVSLEGSTTAALVDGGVLRRLPAPTLSDLMRSTSLEAAAEQAGEVLDHTTMVTVLPTPTKVICCGLNYGDHIQEMGRELPAYPTLFAKFADTLLGPGEDIVLPAGLQVDWEAELGVVVGATLRGADRETARQGIAGYTIANDVSVRDWQSRTLQWFQGKAWDATTPVGPVVVTPDEIDPREGVDVVCRVNGEEVQRGNTSTLVFDAADLVAYVSTFTVLRPGDLILTGTPGGVGLGRTPPRFLADGDVLETEIAGIGTLRNSIRLIEPN